MTSNPGPAESQERLWLADTLWRLGAIQFGDFSLGRTVRNSPVYVNAKLLISRPDALKRTVRLIEEDLELGMAMRNRAVEPFDAVAGVPIGGLHIATALSLQMDRPLLYLVVDDLAAGGGSLVETIEGLRDAGLIVSNAVVLIDREQGAARRLDAMGVKMHSVLSLEVLLTHLHAAGHVTREEYDRSQGYLHREGEPRSEFD
jgi:orotate phosphoribosyltransferase